MIFRRRRTVERVETYTVSVVQTPERVQAAETNGMLAEGLVALAAGLDLERIAAGVVR